ncbi:MAG TPA: hypothetical protein VFB68_09620 [Xanthobacteraceae bacterium]|nr:hypothetical protein [Xanthobacteraceae bacterium]
MITLTKIRELDLAQTGDAGMPRHLSAASGLACPGSKIYVVADDELHLGVFDAAGSAPGRLLRVFDGELPEEKKARKKQKPDLEAITQLPPFGDCPNGALLALGSGSKRNRCRGALLRLDTRGIVDGNPRLVDVSPFFEELERHCPALNIEGAVVIGGELRLLQRANKKHPQNAIVRYPLSTILDALATGVVLGAVTPAAIDIVDLGSVDGIPLSFTDGASLPDGAMVFTAVAEDTEDTYNDGACLGAAIGVVAADGTLRLLEHLDECPKVEGVAARVDANLVKLLLVTDADDPAVPANLFAATLAAW